MFTITKSTRGVPTAQRTPGDSRRLATREGVDAQVQYGAAARPRPPAPRRPCAARTPPPGSARGPHGASSRRLRAHPAAPAARAPAQPRGSRVRPQPLAGAGYRRRRPRSWLGFRHRASASGPGLRPPHLAPGGAPAVQGAQARRGLGFGFGAARGVPCDGAPKPVRPAAKRAAAAPFWQGAGAAGAAGGAALVRRPARTREGPLETQAGRQGRRRRADISRADISDIGAGGQLP